MDKKVIIIGAGGHAKVVADAVRKSGDLVIGFLDDHKPCGESFCGAKILGKISEYKGFADGSCFIVAIGSNPTRKRIVEELDCQWYTAIHPSAVIGDGVRIGEGVFVAAGAVINADAVIEKHSIVNTCAVVEHDCLIGGFSHISPNAAVCGGCEIGELTWIGSGATVINGINICDCVTVGAGAVVVKDIKEMGIFVGVPARKLDK